MQASDFAQLLFTRSKSLSPDLVELGLFVLGNPSEVADKSLPQLTRAMPGSSQKTFRDLALALGFTDYGAMRAAVHSFAYPEQIPGHRIFRAWFSANGKTLQNEAGDKGVNHVIQDILVKEIENIDLAFHRNRLVSSTEPSSFEEAAAVISKGNRVIFLGRRSCHPVAYFLHYVFNFFAPNGHLIPDGGGTIIDAVRWLDDRDVVVAISISPYTTEVVEALQYVHSRGVKIVAMTDLETSPLAENAAAILLVDTRSSSFWHSNICLAAVAHALLAVLFIKSGPEGLRRLQQTEARG